MTVHDEKVPISAVRDVLKDHRLMPVDFAICSCGQWKVDPKNTDKDYLAQWRDHIVNILAAG